MASLKITLFLVLALHICNVWCFKPSRNYCSQKVKELCYNQPHIGCNPKDWDSSNCKNPKMVQMTTELKKLVVHHHNFYREKVATGKGRTRSATFPQAANMLYMDWDEELAYLASLNVKQCKMQHDSCRAVDVAGGQNLYFASFSGKSITHKKSLMNAIRKWYKEIKDANPSDVDKYSGRGNGGAEINHFGALAWGKTNRVGCALAEYDTQYQQWTLKTHLIACNYAPMGNWLGEPMYTKGPACSKCPSGKCKSKYKLCKTFWSKGKKSSKKN